MYDSKIEDHLLGDIAVGTKLSLLHIGSDLRKFIYLFIYLMIRPQE